MKNFLVAIITLTVASTFSLAQTRHAVESMQCSSKPAQLKGLTKALISDMTLQLQAIGYQGVKVRVSTRKMSASENVYADKTGSSFGLAVTMSQGSDGKPAISLNSQVAPTQTVCTYGYRFTFKIRYLNTDSKMVSVSYPPVDFNIQSQILYSNNIR